MTEGLPSGATFPVGTTVNTFEVTDPAGNATRCSFKVMVTDEVPPVLRCPSDMAVYADAGSCSATVERVDLGSPTTTDNCPVTLTWTRSDRAANLTDPFPVGCTVITWTATDSGGNLATCSQKVHVKANLGLVYTGDLFAFSSGATVATAPVLMASHLSSDVTPACVDLATLTVTFKIYKVASGSESLVKTATARMNHLGDAAVVVILDVGGFNSMYKVVASIDDGCGARAISDDALLTVDYGSTERRVTGGGWVVNAQSSNGKANFGYTVGFNKNGSLKGNSVYIVRGTDGYTY